MLLQATDIYVRYGHEPILENESLYIEEKERIAIVGANGQGKSTLLKIIAHKDEAYAKFSCKPQMTISYLEQQPRFNPSKTLWQVFLEQSSPKDDYRFKSFITKFGFTDLNQPIGQLSGGQQKRLALALVLSQEADLLILDEPTNHLDMDMILWLEKYLQHYRGAILMVTHDRYFLERITSTIIEVSASHLYLSHGGYQGYLDNKLMREQDELAKRRKRATLLRQETEWVKAGVEARRTKSKSRLQRYEALLKANETSEAQKMSIDMMMQRLGRKTISFHHVTKSFDNHLLFEDFSYQIQPYDRIGILGDNGSGKTTLLNLICGMDSHYQGVIEIGETIRIGYFDQQSMHLDDSMKAYDYIFQISDAIQTSEGIMNAKSMMMQFLFDDRTMYLPIGRLSGGQKRRLYLFSILMQQPNVLIFDEPTNDLDLDTLTILEDFLDHFNGILITVSHDRYFLDKVVDKMFVFKNQRISIYNGGCSDYLEKDNQTNITQKKEKSEVRVKEKVVKLSYKESKEYEQLQIEMADIEKELERIGEAFEDSQLSYEKAQALSVLQAELEASLEKKTERWFELEEILEKSKK